MKEERFMIFQKVNNYCKENNVQTPEEQWHFRQEKKAGFMQNTQKMLKYT